FAIHGLEPPIEVLHNIASNQLQTFLCTDYGFELGPLRLELLLSLDLLALGNLLKLWVDPGLLGLVKRQFRQPALVIDWDSRPIFHRALDVIDADIVAENCSGVLVCQLDRRPRET